MVAPKFPLQSNLEFVNSVDLGENHVVVEQRLGDDVQDAQPLRRQQLVLTLATSGVNVSSLRTAVSLPWRRPDTWPRGPSPGSSSGF